MIFRPLPLEDAYLIELEKKEDHRGFFARMFCVDELKQNGISFDIVQSSVSYNAKKATLRGLHYQQHPNAEKKVVYCVKGAIFDVIVDLRPTSPTKGQWFAAELSEHNKSGFLIPEGFAHGFQTLCDDCEVLYLISAPYCSESATGICWNDPTLAITWPLEGAIISERDQQLPCLSHDS